MTFGVRSEGNVGGQAVRGWAVAAGAGLVLMAVVAGFGNFFAIGGLVTAGDAERTARDIAGSEGLFRAGIASLFVVVVLDVVVACALYRVFDGVDRTLSLLAATFRLVYAGVFLIAVSHLLGAVDLADSGDALREVDAFSDLWVFGLGLFGAHLLVLGYLLHRSGFAPVVLGPLVAIAGLGYLIDSLGLVFGAELSISSYAFVGELLLALWLLLRGRRIDVSAGSRTAN